MYDPIIAGEIVKALDRFGRYLKENEWIFAFRSNADDASIKTNLEIIADKTSYPDSNLYFLCIDESRQFIQPPL